MLLLSTRNCEQDLKNEDIRSNLLIDGALHELLFHKIIFDAEEEASPLSSIKLMYMWNWSIDKDPFNPVITCVLLSLGNTRDSQCLNKVFDWTPDVDAAWSPPFLMFRAKSGTLPPPIWLGRGESKLEYSTSARQIGQVECAKNQLSMHETWNKSLQFGNKRIVSPSFSSPKQTTQSVWWVPNSSSLSLEKDRIGIVSRILCWSPVGMEGFVASSGWSPHLRKYLTSKKWYTISARQVATMAKEINKGVRKDPESWAPFAGSMIHHLRVFFLLYSLWW